MKKKKGKRNSSLKKIVLFSAMILIISGFLFYIGNRGYTGRIISDLDVKYTEGENLQGVMTFSIKQGELIPASSQIVIENAGQTKSYLLSELVSQKPIQGNFYAEGKSLSGEGEGYGAVGTKKEYPPVEFEMEIYSSSSSKEPTETPTSSTETTPTETTPEEQPPAEETTETPQEISPETISETTSASEEQTSEQQTTETSEPQKKSEEKKEEKTQEKSEEKSKEQKTEEAPAETTTLTGNVIRGIFNVVSNFFLGITGQVSLEIATTVDGEVSADKPFTYELGEGQTAKIVSSSEKVKLKIEGNQAIVTTDYSVEEEGFGEDYLGDTGEQVTLDLENLEFTPQPGELKISIVYNNQEIVSAKRTLSEGGVVETPEEPPEETPETNITETNETISNITEIPETNITETNITNQTEINATEINQTLTGYSLTDEEKEILLNSLGNLSVKVTKAEVVNERLVTRYEISKYWAEYSYDYDGKINNALKEQMEKDRINWLKDIANKISEESGSTESVEELIETYPL